MFIFLLCVYNFELIILETSMQRLEIIIITEHYYYS